jgi:hypothetical protein
MHVYEHQRDAFVAATAHGRDVVLATGTGSGKTEAFLFPILVALLRESQTWASTGPRRSDWDWWHHETTRGRRRRLAPRIAQRSHETRPSAIRALILYSLNALVEDQLGRPRGGMDGPAPRAWLQQHRAGNRIYLCKYTGKTPIAGERTPPNIRRLRTELTSIARDAQAVVGSPTAAFFQNLDGAEAWSRWISKTTHPTS